MAKIVAINTKGEQTQIEIKPGLSLMEQLREHGFDEIEAVCGGACACATCHVYIENASELIDKEALEEAEDIELSLLEILDEYQPEQSRLSCQIPLSNELDGLKVQLVEQV